MQTDNPSLARKLARKLPSHVKQLPWRIGWLRQQDVFKSAPISSFAKLIQWTARESFHSELAFRLPDGRQAKTMRNNFTGLFAHVTGSYEPDLIDFMKSRLTPGATFLDVGANIGLYSMEAAKVVGPTGRIIAIEAHPYTFQFLEKNLPSDTPCNLVLENTALGSAPGELRFRYEKGNSGSSHVAPNGEPADITVPVVPLDTVLERHGVERVDFMKIDVEGFEPEVMRGAGALLARNPDLIIQTEIDGRHLGRYGFSVADLTSLLTAHDLRPHALIQGRLQEVSVETLKFGDFLWARAA